MDIVCIDTNVLIWGIKGEYSAGQNEMVSKAQRFLDHLDRQKIRCLVPSVVVAELLMPLPENEHISFVADVTKRFIIPPFDALAGTYLARVWQSRKGQVSMIRAEIKYDSFIIATALAHKARCIYSNDPNMKTMAIGHIECLEIPDIPMQSGMWE